MLSIPLYLSLFYFFLSTCALTTTATISTLSQNNMIACSECIIHSAFKASPTCTNQSFTPFPVSDSLIDIQRTCYCPLTVSNAWINPCVQQDLCSAVIINVIFRDIVALRPVVCGASATATASITPHVGEPTTSVFYSHSTPSSHLPTGERHPQPSNKISDSCSNSAISFNFIVALIAVALMGMVI